MIKVELTEQISHLANLKKNVYRSEKLDSNARSRLRITIESLLIELNEEIFSISRHLVESYNTEDNLRSLISKAREFAERKK